MVVMMAGMMVDCLVAWKEGMMDVRMVDDWAELMVYKLAPWMVEHWAAHLE